MIHFVPAIPGGTGGGQEITRERTYYVEPLTGDDDTAEVGNPAKPWQTIHTPLQTAYQEAEQGNPAGVIKLGLGDAGAWTPQYATAALPLDNMVMIEGVSDALEGSVFTINGNGADGSDGTTGTNGADAFHGGAISLQGNGLVRLNLTANGGAGGDSSQAVGANGGNSGSFTLRGFTVSFEANSGPGGNGSLGASIEIPFGIGINDTGAITLTINGPDHTITLGDSEADPPPNVIITSGGVPRSAEEIAGSFNNYVASNFSSTLIVTYNSGVTTLTTVATGPSASVAAECSIPIFPTSALDVSATGSSGNYGARGNLSPIRLLDCEILASESSLAADGTGGTDSTLDTWRCGIPPGGITTDSTVTHVDPFTGYPTS